MPVRRYLPIAWLLALLLIPAASWIIGGRQGLLDNRPKTPMPAFNVKTLRHEAFYKQLDAAFFERLPPRGRALDLHGRIAVDVFRDSSSPMVALGGHGYRYYVPGTRTCGDAPPAYDPADAADILARTLVAAGKRALVIEPADKLFVHPQDVPDDFPGKLACARALEQQVEQRLSTTPGGGSIDGELRTDEAAGHATYLKTDTHWNGTGRLAYVRRALDALRPGLAAQTGVRLGNTYNKNGDMNAMLGLTSSTERDRLVTADHAADPAFAPGSALVIGDSQTERAFTDPLPGGLPSFAQQFLPGVTFCSIPNTTNASCDKALLSSKSIVVESVGRNLIDFEGMCARPVGLLGEQLTGPAGAYAGPDGGALRHPRRFTMGAGGTEEVRIVPRGGADSATVPRLIRIPVESLAAGQQVTMTQDPHNGLAAPCAAGIQSAAGTSLILPVPAKRKLSDLPIVLRAPAGTVLGAPRVIALDGSPAPRAAAGQHG